MIHTTISQTDRITACSLGNKKTVGFFGPTRRKKTGRNE
jgi:hypothetical protein